MDPITETKRKVFRFYETILRFGEPGYRVNISRILFRKHRFPKRKPDHLPTKIMFRGGGYVKLRGCMQFLKESKKWVLKVKQMDIYWVVTPLTRIFPDHNKSNHILPFTFN